MPTPSFQQRMCEGYPRFLPDKRHSGCGLRRTLLGRVSSQQPNVSDTVIGIERMTPNVISPSTLATPPTTCCAASPLILVADFFRKPISRRLDTDPNFGHCNGPVTVFNNVALPLAQLPYARYRGSITDNSVAYRTATNADPGGSRDTLPHWFTANGFPSTGEAKAIYFKQRRFEVWTRHALPHQEHNHRSRGLLCE